MLLLFHNFDQLVLIIFNALMLVLTRVFSRLSISECTKKVCIRHSKSWVTTILVVIETQIVGHTVCPTEFDPTSRVNNSSIWPDIGPKFFSAGRLWQGHLGEIVKLEENAQTKIFLACGKKIWILKKKSIVATNALYWAKSLAAHFHTNCQLFCILPTTAPRKTVILLWNFYKSCFWYLTTWTEIFEKFG